MYVMVKLVSCIDALLLSESNPILAILQGTLSLSLSHDSSLAYYALKYSCHTIEK